MRNRHGSWINRARKSERSLELAMAFQRPPREGLRLGSIRNVRLTRVVDSKKGHTWGTERNEVGSVNILIFRHFDIPSESRANRTLAPHLQGRTPARARCEESTHTRRDALQIQLPGDHLDPGTDNACLPSALNPSLRPATYAPNAGRPSWAD